VPQPSIFKNKVFNDGVYREDIVDVQLHYQLYLAKMGTVEANAPLQAPCTPTKLSECQTDSSVESNKKLKLSKEPYTFNVLPREMVKIMDASKKEEYLNKCQMVQNDILEIFISEFK